MQCHDLSEEFISTDTFTSSIQLANGRIITKTIYLDITPSIRSTFKSKLWCMGKYWSALGSKKHT